ncbi:lasso peptide biosynthesis B2 protein [Mesorhizobium sp. M8A.F.Ca.ET.202.01.1.1]|nr:lasso peptide biosynthesis B2 protein [Mesorhizobium sp. M8A.F.Ca.ET.202.01.1.1]TGR20831.1 lasso peptide biosynthesis B2 protein [Mesorhizobium sp. M8A.F.Ca.ET.197.01.1.1]TGR38056.1 lasso peptide biosynthesis B2 protein [bacterium M00.F.Ca.ET.199.01.1.1]TGR43912.1 lasso peptide biosynthesis B2 protein [Mesorhizobium sp. M8A.F.Ca.ET.198.01.1.1]TGU26351.1 lasso peptide biosynthesis B2 protein [bacterium M00.F.Ca.ET.156.01.1.1]TGV83050.1 lasso peptide biosynthesis B2 protein [Mesorhizobium sp.
MRPSSRQVSQKAMVARQRPVTQRPPAPMKRPGRRSLARILALSGSEAFFLAHCLLVVATVRLGLTVFSYNRVRRMVTRLNARQCASMGELRLVAWGVAAAARFVPGATCLTQALSGQYLLARKGNASNIRIGIERGTGEQLKAHAWLVSDNHIVLGGSIDGFAHLVDHGSR